MRETENVIPRPVLFAEYICDPVLKTRMQEHITAARVKGVLPPHMLFSGQPGTGKTTMAMIVAKTLNLPVFRFVGQELKKPAQLKELFKTPASGAMLFIDEIHSISKEIGELLYPIMEDRQMSSPTDPALLLYLNPLLVVGATTEPGSLEKPLLDRFALKFNIPQYTDQQMVAIVAAMARKMGYGWYTPDGIEAVARRSKNVPRVAGNLIYQVNDCAIANGVRVIDEKYVGEVMSRNGVTLEGFDETDRGIITALRQHGLLGLNTLAAIVGQAPEWIEKVYEPYLMRQGYIQRTPRGRALTERGMALRF